MEGKRKKDGDTETKMAMDMEYDEVFAEKSTTVRRTPPLERTSSLSEERTKEPPIEQHRGKELGGSSKSVCPDPFKRRDSIGRSPTRTGGRYLTGRSSSTSKVDTRRDTDDANPRRNEGKNAEETETEKGNTKRQRENSEEELKELKQMFTKLKNAIHDLTKEVQQNTRVEIKKGIKIAKGQADEIVRKWDVLTLQLRERKKSRWTENEDEDVIVVEESRNRDEESRKRVVTLEKEMENLRRQKDEEKKVLEQRNLELEQRIKSLEKKLREKGKNVGKECVTGEELEGISRFEEYQTLQQKPWEDKIFKSAFMVMGTPHDGNKDTDLVYIGDEEDSPPEKEALRHTFINRYPEISELEGWVNNLSNITRIVDREGVTSERERIIFRVEAGQTARDWFDTLKEVKRKAQEAGRKKISFYPPNRDPSGTETRRMLECIFRDTQIKCLVHVRKHKSAKDRKTTPDKKRETEALVVSQTEGQYADLVRAVKNKVRPESTAAAAIKTIRKARDGKMVIIMDSKDQEARDALVDEVKKVQGVKTRVAGRGSNKAVVYLRGIDAITTREDVIQAIGDIEAMRNTQYEISELRPTLGGNQTATITLEGNKADVLVSTGNVRIALSWCNLEKRIDVVQCYKCWGYGHARAKCPESIDRRDACRKCGKGGHLSEDCKGSERCLTCKVEGHRAGSGRCPEFRKALSRARLRARKQRAY